MTDLKNSSTICSLLMVVVTIIVATHNVMAQQTLRPMPPDPGDKGYVRTIQSKSFDKMITQHVTYAITGENIPTGGVKVDLTKATGTLTGFIYNPNGMDVSIDVGVGVTEGSSALFSSYDNLHSDFNLTANLIYIPFRSSAGMEPASQDVIRTRRFFYFYK